MARRAAAALGRKRGMDWELGSIAIHDAGVVAARFSDAPAETYSLVEAARSAMRGGFSRCQPVSRPSND